MDRVGSLRWRLRSWWYATLHTLGMNRAPSIAYLHATRKGKDQAGAGRPIIGQQGGGGGGHPWDFHYFIWPLPPDGQVTITCKWPARARAADRGQRAQRHRHPRGGIEEQEPMGLDR